MPIPDVPPRPEAPFPGQWAFEASGVAIGRGWNRVWQGSGPHRLSLAFPRGDRLAAHPHDRRPTYAELGRQRLDGRWVFHGEVMELPPGGDPWDRQSPSRRHAEAMHAFGWLGDVLVVEDSGPREALRLALEWRRLFGRWNAFAWSGKALERRVFNWACGLPAMIGLAAEAEGAGLCQDLARQARALLSGGGAPDRAMERAAAAGVAGAALAGAAGDRLLDAALRRLERGLPSAVLPDGGHASRTPERALELLFDLLALDDGLSQRGRPPPAELSRAIDRLFTAVRAFTLADGRLPCLQGGDESRASRIRAALASDDGAGRCPNVLPDSGYHRLEAGQMQVFVDAGPPARGIWSTAAVAQPLAVEIVAGGRRLITQVGWTPDNDAPAALRLADGGSTASLDESSAGAPVRGAWLDLLGPRLAGGAAHVWADRAAAPEGAVLDMGHDGWVRSLGLWHQRSLFLSPEGELRGEDAFTPLKPGDPSGPRRYVAFTVRFHLDPEVSASVARDKRSVLLRVGPHAGWRLRNDAADVLIEPSLHYRNGEARRTSQMVLKGMIRLDIGGRVRWKLSPAEA